MTATCNRNKVMRSAAVLASALVCLLAGQQQLRAQEAPGMPVVAATPAPVPVPNIVKVIMHTAQGDIHLEIDKGRAPITAANFLRYVDQKRFDGITFYRAVKADEAGNYGFVQGGLRGDTKRLYPPIAYEAPAKTGLSHVNGAISMAMLKPGTAAADFFIIVGDLAAMDGKNTPEDPGYAVFGRVTEGMDLVKAIMVMPKSPTAGEGVMKGSILAETVRVLTVRRE